MASYIFYVKKPLKQFKDRTFYRKKSNKWVFH